MWVVVFTGAYGGGTLPYETKREANASRDRWIAAGYDCKVEFISARRI